MNGFVCNIEKDSLKNDNFRQVLYTAPHSQLVLMCLNSNEEIGEEVHNLDQFFRVEKGVGKAIINGVEHQISDGTAIVIPEGTNHNIVNTSPTEKLKLYTIYSPANHRDQIAHASKAEAEADNEHFDGKTSEGV